jgi:hypothetical protein
MNSFLSMTYSSNRCLNKGSFNCCKWNPCYHAHASSRSQSTSLMSVISCLFIGSIPVKAWEQNNEVCVVHIVLFHTVFMSHSLIYMLLCWLPNLLQCCMLYYLLSVFSLPLLYSKLIVACTVLFKYVSEYFHYNQFLWGWPIKLLRIPLRMLNDAVLSIDLASKSACEWTT